MEVNPANIFRSYDIRGVYGKEIDESVMHRIGYAFGIFSDTDIVVGMDMRVSTPTLAKAFMEGVQQSGKNTTNIGILPLSVAVFYAWKTKKHCAYITASHLTKEWNGAKFFHPDGTGLMENDIKRIRNLFLNQKMKTSPAEITDLGNTKPLEQYKNFIAFKLQPKKKLKIVLDAGNGTASLVADIFEKAGHNVVKLFCDLDGTFPNRLSDPHEDKLEALKAKTIDEKADIGFAFDGDADRLAVISDTGQKLTPEQISYICLKDLLKTEKGAVVANVECTRLIDDIAHKFNCAVIRIPVGHTFLMDAVKKHAAVFGTEVSGHMCIPSLLPLDDAIAIAYFIAANAEEKISETVKTIPKYPFERVNLQCMDEIKFRVTERLKKKLSKKYKNVNTMDGIRIDFSDSWLLIRPSNTEPKIRLTIEADNKERLTQLKQEFTELLKQEIAF